MIRYTLSVAWLVGLAVSAGVVYWLLPEQPSTSGWQALIYVAAPTTAALTGVWATRQYRLSSKQGQALAAITLGVIGWCIGEILWTYYEQVAQIDPYPSLADFFYLLGYVSFGIGIFLEIQFLRSTGRQRFPEQQLVLLAIIALLLTGIALYFGVYLAIKPEYTWIENSVAMAYGLADVAIVVFGLMIGLVTWEMRGGKLAKPWWWFLVGMCCVFIADVLFAMYTEQYEAGQFIYKALLDTLWVASYLAIAYAFLQQVQMVYSVKQLANRTANLHNTK